MTSESQEFTLRPQSWSFVEDVNLKVLLEKDYKELRKLAQARLHKSTAVMCGSIVEAVLVALLKKPNQEEQAKEKFHELYLSNSNKTAPAIIDWKFFQLIGVAKGLKLLDDEANDLAHFLKDYRNLIHPMASIRAEAQLDHDTIITILASFRKVIRELSRQSNSHPEKLFMQEVVQRRGDIEARVATKLIEWAKTKSISLEWKRKTCIFRLPHNGYTFSPLVLSIEGRLRVRFGDLKKRKPFRRIAKRYNLLQRLNEIEGVNFHKSDAEGFPAISFNTLVDENKLVQFLSIQDTIVEQIKQT